MATQAGNLSTSERTLSASLGVLASAIALRPGPVLFRMLAGVSALALGVRAASGHCAVKAALKDGTPLNEALSDQWRCLQDRRSVRRHGVPGSPLHSERSARVDEAVSESFPASDPPASRLPDEPPANAAAKWAAARAAGEALS